MRLLTWHFYALGLVSDDEVVDVMKAVMKSEALNTEQREISYDDVLKTTFKLICKSGLLHERG